MQAAVHQMPQMLSQYPRQSFNGIVNGAHAVPPTPPVATRKRKRPHQYTVSYSEVQEVDSEGKLREVIVIDDTPPPPTISPATTYTNGFSASYQPPQYSAPIRTRARAAAEAQALSASTSSAAIIPPAPKKRKRDPIDDPRATVTKKTDTASRQQQPVATTKSWASGSGAATDDVRISSPASVSEAMANVLFFRRPRAPYLAMIKRGII
jgi:dual-specificity kinase